MTSLGGDAMPLPADLTAPPRLLCGAPGCPLFAALGERCHTHHMQERLGCPTPRRGGRCVLRKTGMPKVNVTAWRTVSLAAATSFEDEVEAEIGRAIAETLTATRTPVQSLCALWSLSTVGFFVA